MVGWVIYNIPMCVLSSTPKSTAKKSVHVGRLCLRLLFLSLSALNGYRGFCSPLFPVFACQESNTSGFFFFLGKRKLKAFDSVPPSSPISIKRGDGTIGIEIRRRDRCFV